MLIRAEPLQFFSLLLFHLIFPDSLLPLYGSPVPCISYGISAWRAGSGHSTRLSDRVRAAGGMS